MKGNILTPSNDTILRINPTLAKEIGVNESIVLLQLEYLISISTTEPKDGNKWTYQSLSDLRENYFPFWSCSTINRAIKGLIEKNLIFVANFNKYKYDRTRWFAINYDEVNKIRGVEVRGFKNLQQNSNSQNDLRSNQDGVCETQNRTADSQKDLLSNQDGTTIPETPTETPAHVKLNKAGFDNPAIISRNIKNQQSNNNEALINKRKISIREFYSQNNIEEYVSWFPQKYRPLALAHITGSIIIPERIHWLKWKEVYEILLEEGVSPEDLKLASFYLFIKNGDSYSTREIINITKIICKERKEFTEAYQSFAQYVNEKLVY